MLALRGGAELVALWAQLASLIELVSGVALAGLGTGLAVYVARNRRADVQLELARSAFKLGLAVAAPVAIGTAVVGFLSANILSGGQVGGGVLVLAAAAGWIAILPGLVGAMWLGQERRGAMLAFALATGAVTLAVALAAPPRFLLEALVLAQALPAVIVWFIAKPGRDAGRFQSRSQPLLRYLLPSVAIGVLSPASMLVARAAVGDALSWHDAGVLQALWRVQDWVCGFASGVLSVYYLPQLAAARGDRDRFRAVLRAAATWTLAVSAVVLLLSFLAHRPLVAALYAEGVEASGAAAALFFLGGWVRIAAWVPMFALYALRRTHALALGELLSLPLFAALVLATGRWLTLELAGALWIASYCAYLAFNLRALRRP